MPAGGRHVSRIFISYRRSDSEEICGRIYDRLAAAFGGSSIFKDVDAIPGGVDFRRTINDALAQCKIMLVIIGPGWMGALPDGRLRFADPNDFVRVEVETAFLRRIPVMPILVRSAQMPDVARFAPSLINLQYQNARTVRNDPDFHTDMDRVIKDLARVVPLPSAGSAKRQGSPISQHTGMASPPMPVMQQLPSYPTPQLADRPFPGWSRPFGGAVYKWGSYLFGIALMLGSAAGGLYYSYVVMRAPPSTVAYALWGTALVGAIIAYFSQKRVPKHWRRRS